MGAGGVSSFKFFFHSVQADIYSPHLEAEREYNMKCEHRTSNNILEDISY